MRRAVPTLLALVAALALGACFHGEPAGQGDPRCFAEDAGNASCTSSEGVRYWVVDRGDEARVPDALAVRLVEGPDVDRGRVTAAVRLVSEGGPFEGDVALLQDPGEIFPARAVTPAGDRVELAFEVPPGDADRLDEYPSYLSFGLPPARCPGGGPQCFAYIRLWK